MPSFVQSTYDTLQPGAETALLAAGTSLEHPIVYDSAAREVKAMAEDGLVEITDEVVRRTPTFGALISHIRFRKVR